MIGVAWGEPERKHVPEVFKNIEAISLQEIAREICEQYKIPMRLLTSDRRNREYVIPRHHFMYRAATETTYSTPQIGRFCGNKDHTTVLHGVKRHKERMGL